MSKWACIPTSHSPSNILYTRISNTIGAQSSHLSLESGTCFIRRYRVLSTRLWWVNNIHYADTHLVEGNTLWSVGHHLLLLVHFLQYLLPNSPWSTTCCCQHSITDNTSIDRRPEALGTLFNSNLWSADLSANYGLLVMAARHRNKPSLNRWPLLGLALTLFLKSQIILHTTTLITDQLVTLI